MLPNDPVKRIVCNTEIQWVGFVEVAEESRVREQEGVPPTHFLHCNNGLLRR